MTSSSDGDFPLSRRRLFVHGISYRTAPGVIEDFFAPYGSVSSVYNSLRGFAFVTFENEAGARNALRADGAKFQGRTLKVEFSHAQNPPLAGARRVIPFPCPFGGRGRGSGTSSASRGNTVSSPPTSPNRIATTGNSRGSRSGRARGGGSSSHRYYQRQLPSPQSRQSHQLVPNSIRIIHFSFQEELDVQSCLPDEMVENYQKLFCFDLYPHITKKIFRSLDAVSLIRCKLVCKRWNETIKKSVENVSHIAECLKNRWQNGECSFYPINPLMYEMTRNLNFADENPDSSYRNVLALKCDELEIILAVDNGNVEIYDRYSLRLKTILIGKFSSSPASVDISPSILLVSYTCGFGWAGRKFASSWNIYDRQTKKLLHSIERDGGEDNVRIGFRDDLLLITRQAVYQITNFSDESTPQMKKIYVTHESNQIEAFDLDRGHEKAVAIVKVDSGLMMNVWTKPKNSNADEQTDFMTHLEDTFPLLNEYASKENSFIISKCKGLSVQLRYPLALCFFSNSYGYFEYFEDRGRPYSLLSIYDVREKICLRTVTLDQNWMIRHDIVSFDYDSGVLNARFNQNFMIAGLGSFSDYKDGGIAVWSMSELLSDNVGESDLIVTTLPAPAYHWMGWDGHTGGVHALYMDTYQLIAVNSCAHQIATRCIEGGDESKKDNVIVYDFWTPGSDKRRMWCGYRDTDNP